MNASWLQELTVLELTDGVGGSFAASVLATLGARVIKIAPGRLEPARAALDVDKQIAHIGRGHEQLELIAAADIVIADILATPTSYRAPLFDLARRGNPGVWVWLSAFGLDGARRDHLGSDLISLAAGGVLASGLREARAEYVPTGEQGLVTLGQVAALAALHGLDRFQCDAQPVEIDVSAQDAVLHVSSVMEFSLRLGGQIERPADVPPQAPTSVFACRDGLIRLAAPDTHQWNALVRAMGRPAWAETVTKDQLRTETEAINARVGQWTATFDRTPLVAFLQESGVAAAEVNQPLDALTSEQFGHRGFFVQRELAASTAELPGPPFTIEVPRASRAAPGSLRGLSVVEVTGAIAGPLASSLLGAMGATIVRARDPNRSDIYERKGPFIADVDAPGRSISYNAINHSKTWRGADLGAAIDADLAASCAAADVVIDNLSRDYRARLGLPTLAREWDNLYVTISGFGRTGPRSSYRAYGPNLHSYAGLSSTTADPSGWPWERQTPIGDTAAAIWAATVVAAWALGAGSAGIVDLSLAEVVAARLVLPFARAQLPANTRATPSSALLPCRAETWLAVSIDSPAQVEALARLLDAPTADPGHLLASLSARVSDQPAVDWADTLQGAGVAATAVWSFADLAQDPDLLSRGFIARVAPIDDEDTGLRVGVPWRFVGSDPIRISPVRTDA